jgi:hypothetical protein
MKRGLVVLDPTEIPEPEWTGRVTDLQERLSAEGISVALVYGDVYRSDDIGFLTNLCIYWNEGIVAVPADGEPVFLTKLSPRVHTWMRATSKVSDLRSGKSFGSLVQTLMADRAPGVVGLVDGALWPGSVVDEVTAALPGWDVRVLGGVVRDQRLVPSTAELALLRAGGAVLQQALSASTVAGVSATERIAVVEQQLRGSGFTDLTAEVSTTTDGVLTLEVTGEYRHGWLHAARLVQGRAAATWVTAVEEALGAAVAAVAEGSRTATLTAAAEPALASLPAGASWYLSCVNQADMATHGELQSSDDALLGGSVVVVGIEVLFQDGGRAAVADTVLVAQHHAQSLTSSQPTAADVDSKETL